MPGFLKLLLSGMSIFMLCVCMCVLCSHPMLPLTSGIMWHDMDPYDWFSKLYSFYIAALVGMISGHGLSIDVCHINGPNES